LDRALLAEYEATIEELLAALTPHTHALAVQIAALPERVRGYGVVREAAAQAMRKEHAELLAQWRDRPS
jgi:indolepyruvate ferredoxin oxidoreductase